MPSCGISMQQSLASHINELEQLSDNLKERNEVLRKAYEQAKEADKMKTFFLHHMTNQMIEPADTLEESVETLCNDYNDGSLQKADHEVGIIQKQSQEIIKLVNSMIHVAEDEIKAMDKGENPITRKEAADE